MGRLACLIVLAVFVAHGGTNDCSSQQAPMYGATSACDCPAQAAAKTTTRVHQPQDWPGEVVEEGWATLRNDILEVTVVDNRSFDEGALSGHRAGYHGIAKLSHVEQNRTPFVPAYSGLNFEHIHDGTVQDRDILFEPRRAPIELRRIDNKTVALYQPATPFWQLESFAQYELLDDGVIELTFECIPRADLYDNGYIGLFWASYVDQPERKTIHFIGTPNGDLTDQESEPSSVDFKWIEAETPQHGVLSTHVGVSDRRRFDHEESFPLTLVFNRSDYRFDQPWYFGVCRGMAIVYMFRPQDNIRLTQSPSGGGEGNPAWDFQWFIEDYTVGEKYSMVMRMACVPYQSHEQVERAVRHHRRALGQAN